MKTTYDERLMPEEARDQLIYDEHLVRYESARKLAAGKVILDVASGEGYGTAILAKVASKAIGVDINAEAVEKASLKYAHIANLEFVNDSAESLEKVASATVDLAVSFETIEHLTNQDGYLRALSRVLKPDGVALISTPNKDVFHEENPYHIREFTKKEFAEELKKHFSFVKLYEQANGLASMIKAEGTAGSIIVSNSGEAQYFIALCSPDEHCSKRLACDLLSFNVKALEKRDNNPAWKMINRLYKFYKKFL